MNKVLTCLFRTHSWKLEKLSKNTFPRDITFKLGYLTPKQSEAIVALMKNGQCYRCRIGKGRYWFGGTAVEAAKLALEEYENQTK